MDQMDATYGISDLRCVNGLTNKLTDWIIRTGHRSNLIH